MSMIEGPDISLTSRIFTGLERSCENGAHERIIAAPSLRGIERIEASFYGNAFEPHRHDTYAIGVTLQGVQSFCYRGSQRISTPGRIIVLHPDERHDGAAATEDRLRYRMLYLEPALLRRGLENTSASLPFVGQPVIDDHELLATLLTALDQLDREIDELLADDLVAQIAAGLARHSSVPFKPLGGVAIGAATRARDFLEDNATRVVRSAELEDVSGLDRYSLSRHFRAVFATSPHRYLLMRRLQKARTMIATGMPLADIAAAVGFADQSHFHRQFKQAFGLTPGRWSRLSGGGNLTTNGS